MPNAIAWVIAGGGLALGCAKTEAPSPVASAPPTAMAPVVATPAVATPIRIVLGGDLIPHRPTLVEPAAIRAALAPLASTFDGADAVVANYEAATGLEDPKFRLAYAAPPEWMGGLKDAGITAVTVANNHACDLARDGVDATLASAASANMTAIGGDLHDPWAPRVLAQKGNHRVCAIAWTTFVNAEGGCARTVRLAHASLDARGKAAIEQAMIRARKECDATIAIFHGGEEYAQPTRGVLDQAAFAAEAGADAVVVHHPHVVAPLVVHPTRDGRRVPIFASVGNLVSNQGESWKEPMFPVLRENRRLVCVNGWTRLGMLADLRFDFGAAGDVTLAYGYHLVWVDNAHAEDRKTPRPKIEARVFDLQRDEDRAVVARFRDDDRGPAAVFDDPCWREGQARDDARCEVHEERARVAPPRAARRKRR